MALASDPDTGLCMVPIKCPKCQSELEIDDAMQQKMGVTAVFCKNEDCSFNKNPIVGLDRKIPAVYISESLL